MIPESTAARQMALVASAQQALSRLFLGLDTSDYDLAVSAFTRDGCWLRQGKTLTGHAEMIEALEARPGSQITLHVLSNVLPHEEEVRFYLTVYRSATQTGGEWSPTVPAVAGMGCCRMHDDRIAWLQTGPYPFHDSR